MMRVILAKIGLDGHDKGLRIVAQALRDAGLEVIYLGLRNSAKQIANAALQEDAGAIGISILSGVHLTAAKQLIFELQALAIKPKIVLGGTIPEVEIPILEDMGIAKIFPVETNLHTIVDYFRKLNGLENGSPNPRNEQMFPQTQKSEEVTTDSGIPVKLFYTSEDTAHLNDKIDLGLPGEYPYTRGPYRTMYRGRVWTMRQYAGFGTAADSNRRYQYLLSQGQTGLSVAFDLPTQLGYDSDDPGIVEEVGRVGVAIDTIEDMLTLFDGIPLNLVSVNFTINSTAIIILAMFMILAEERGFLPSELSGTIQNDIIKEFLARNTYIFPLDASLRIAGDIIAYSSLHFPRFNPISCSGYHIRELGANAVQELALTLGGACIYIEEIRKRGIGVDQFASRLSFQLSCNQDFFEEIAKFRAARRMWARIMKERFGALSENSCKFRVFSGGNGISLTAQEPLNNIVRGAYQCLAAALGGAQAIHVPAFDEAYAIPTQESALLCLRTQQIAAYETGITRTVDPLAGSYYLESLTDELEKQAREMMARIDEQGGLVECIQSGWIQKEVIHSAFQTQKDIDTGKKVTVGVNRYKSEGDQRGRIVLEKAPVGVMEEQREKLQHVKDRRDSGEVAAAMVNLETTAASSDNLFPAVIRAVRARATIGEIVTVMKRVFGEYRGQQAF
jgi:methylmalonyl-CoA mutase N-terminal domain/subunit